MEVFSQTVPSTASYPITVGRGNMCLIEGLKNGELKD
jgi:hypothetical protein